MAGIKTASGMTLGSLYFDGLRKVLGAIRCCQTAGAVTLTLTPVNKRYGRADVPNVLHP